MVLLDVVQVGKALLEWAQENGVVYEVLLQFFVKEAKKN